MLNAYDIHVGWLPFRQTDWSEPLELTKRTFRLMQSFQPRWSVPCTFRLKSRLLIGEIETLKWNGKFRSNHTVRSEGSQLKAGYSSLDQSVLFIFSLRSRRFKGMGKGVLGARETQGAREEGGKKTPFPSSLLPRAWSSALIPFPSLSNACHAG